ncbi:uncharacterized protein LOC112513690 [Cynara cardunculus var. scolymus]|uniref:uncharacterized protein LOC112513690 n=1 Tax=Cynara cardunculus var. scolymus TaxID=59895 RepID=UPI000D62FC07|nr:uncharacterized protein LOC112513690 [Cynara cardunculus var. scolymus]
MARVIRDPIDEKANVQRSIHRRAVVTAPKNKEEPPVVDLVIDSPPPQSKKCFNYQLRSLPLHQSTLFQKQSKQVQPSKTQIKQSISPSSHHNLSKSAAFWTRFLDSAALHG